MKSLSFDDLVEHYDRTRTFDPAAFHSALDYLCQAYPPARFPRLFEPGIGTGRIAVPLAQRGYQVKGVDLSGEMLARLRGKLAAANPSAAGPAVVEIPRQAPLLEAALPAASVQYQVANVTALPYADAFFDLAVAVHLFYFVDGWRKAASEILRVVRPGQPVVLMHTGSGEEIPFINHRYRTLCAERGCPAFKAGVTSTQEVLAYYTQLGCQVTPVKERWQWSTPVSLENALEDIRARSYSFTVSTPEETHQWAVDRLAEELLENYHTLRTVIEVPNHISLIFVSHLGGKAAQPEM